MHVVVGEIQTREEVGVRGRETTAEAASRLDAQRKVLKSGELVDLREIYQSLGLMEENV